MKTPPSLFLPALGVMFCILATGSIAHAQSTSTWDGGASTTNWNDGDNWDPNGVPVGNPTTSSSPSTMVNAVLPNLTDPYSVNYGGTDGIVNNLTITNATMNVSGIFSVLGPNHTTGYGNTNLNAATLNIGVNAEYTGAASLFTTNGSMLDVASGATFSLSKRTTTVNSIERGSTVNISGDMFIDRTAQIRIRDSNDIYGSTTITVSGGNLEGTLSGGNRSSIFLGQSSTATTANTLNVENNGTVTLGAMNLGSTFNTSATSGGANHNTVNLSSGIITLLNELILARPGIIAGAYNNPSRVSTNTVNITGGSLTAGGGILVGVGRVGIIDLSDGTLSTGAGADVNIGGFITGLITPTTAEHYGEVNVSGGSLAVGEGGIIRVASAVLENSAQIYDGFSTAGSLNIADGTVTAGGLTAGGFNSAYATPALINSGTVTVSGGVLAISGEINLAGAVIATGVEAGFRTPGILNITGGTVSAGSLIANYSQGAVNFSAGHLTAGSATINTGSAFQVGDGTGASGSAVYRMNGGTHTFEDGLIIASDGKLTGFGATTAQISGSGTIDPGNSPGIITAASVDPSGGLGFNFGFTQANAAPLYDNPQASGNDILRLSNESPFGGDLGKSNTVSLWLDVAAISGGDIFYGGFYIDAGDYFSSIENASFLVFVRGDGSGTHEYNGVQYLTLAEYNTAFATSFDMEIGTVLQAANFGSGSVNGYVTTLNVVPEPHAVALLGFGLLCFCIFRRGRRLA